MSTSQPTLPDLLEQLPTNEDEWPEEIRTDLAGFKKAQAEEGGLIPNATCSVLFNVSRQRWDQIANEYHLKRWTFFKKKWFSQTQLEEFHRINRQALGGHHKSKLSMMAAMLKEGLADARKD